VCGRRNAVSAVYHTLVSFELTILRAKTREEGLGGTLFHWGSLLCSGLKGRIQWKC